MKTINVALVGAGFMGKAHTVALANMPKLFWPAPVYPVFKTVCDIVPEIARMQRFVSATRTAAPTGRTW